ncbi:hypothetical protein K435DRAFT_706490, partial [Dendrothele bispora CBS 962.96]
IREFINRSFRFMSAYRLGLTGKAAEWAVRKQKGHRVVSNQAMASIGAVLHKSGGARYIAKWQSGSSNVAHHKYIIRFTSKKAFL